MSKTMRDKITIGGVFLVCAVTHVLGQEGISFGGQKKEEGVNSDGVGVRAGGLLASILNKDPLGNGRGSGQSSNLQEGRTARHCCCSLRGRSCPVERNFGDDFDIDNFGDSVGVNPRVTGVNARNKDKPDSTIINTRIVNNPVNSPPPPSLDRCPTGSSRCCYTSSSFVNSLGSTCPKIGGGGFDGGFGGGFVNEFSDSWRQGCDEQVFGRGRRCGSRNFRHISGLRRGEASPDEFPWLCLVLNEDNNFVASCAIVPMNSDNRISSGTSKVITAAHKLDNVGRTTLLKVRVNEYDASAFHSPEKTRHQEFQVVRFHKYPRYKPGRYLNDIAILHLDKKIDLISYNGINAACVPPCRNMFDYQFQNNTGVRCWVAGWGKDRSNGQFQTVMHKVDVPIYDSRRCELALKEALQNARSRNAGNFRLHPSEVCAGGEQGKDACDGDGGAPLVCRARSGLWYVEGLVTWGVDCALRDVPGVYAKVSRFRRWIDECPRRSNPNDFSRCDDDLADV